MEPYARPPSVEQRLYIPLSTAAERVIVGLEFQLSAGLSMMNAEITIKKIRSKWHGYIDGRSDIDETALTEDAVRRKMEQLRDRIGRCELRRTCSVDELASWSTDIVVLGNKR